MQVRHDLDSLHFAPSFFRAAETACKPGRHQIFPPQRRTGHHRKLYVLDVRDKQHMGERTRSFLAETFKILDRAGKSPHSKGNHIFVNPIDPRSAY